MSQFDELIEQLKKEDYDTKRQLLEMLNQLLRKGRKPGPEDRHALREYVFGEIDVLLKAIPNAPTYREKDEIMACEDLILGLVMALCPIPGDVPADVLAKIQLLVKLVEQQRHLETELERIFAQKTIEAKDISHLCYLTGRITDEYQKGRLYAGLIHFAPAVRRLSDEARVPLTQFLGKEMERYLAMEDPDRDCVENLELMADVAKHFPDERIFGSLNRLTEMENHTLVFFAAESLLACGRTVSDAVIHTLAGDLVYAELTYRILENHGQSHRFPKECSDEVYLAKSDLVHWLTYPTELGQVPDEIEYIGKITYLFRKDYYHVFRFRSDSDTLDDAVKGKWLIGWSGPDGGTFSKFEEYDLYKKDTLAATLKHIKKKVIG